jgi:D-beta-D-heptose 7-phosphate kinase/D-beta-D-heptose 1-phosphate adenosyltransferase
MLPPSLQQTLERLHNQQKKVVLVTGVFDVLHSEHEAFLKKAKQQGDFLVVALESDQRVRQIKGSGRPINNQLARLQNLLRLSIADEVFILPDDFGSPAQHEELIRQIKPDFLAISSHTAHQPEKKKIVEKYGGQLAIVHQHNPAISSTQIIEANKRKA